jgi:CRP/FNR family transcriptional regulator
MSPIEVHKTSEQSYMPLSFNKFLSTQELDLLYESSNVISYEKRDSVIKQGSRITDIPLVVSGLAKVSREMRKGKNLILRIAQPGQFLGLSSVLASENYEYTVTALETTTIRFIKLETFKRIMESNSLFACEIATTISRNNLYHISRLSSLLSKQLPGRVADIILYFSEELYKSDKFTIPLTRQELAELAGTTKESLIRTLSEFKHDKIIDMNRNFFSINSITIIRTLSRLG